MANRLNFGKLTVLSLVASLGLTACDATSTGNPGPTVTRVTASSGEVEKQLERQAAALQRTILEGALVGTVAGGLLDRALGGDDNIGAGIGIGLVFGASAGTYVAHMQKKFINKERRLRAIKSDIDENSAEVQQTINVMNEVLAVQRAELAAVRAMINTGTGSPAELEAELAQAKVNLANMQRAIDGANKRYAELGTVRGLTLVNDGASVIDPDLAALSQQIALMKAIASDLATEL